MAITKQNTTCKRNSKSDKIKERLVLRSQQWQVLVYLHTDSIIDYNRYLIFKTDISDMWLIKHIWKGCTSVSRFSFRSKIAGTYSSPIHKKLDNL